MADIHRRADTAAVALLFLRVPIFTAEAVRRPGPARGCAAPRTEATTQVRAKPPRFAAVQI